MKKIHEPVKRETIYIRMESILEQFEVESELEKLGFKMSYEMPITIIGGGWCVCMTPIKNRHHYVRVSEEMLRGKKVVTFKQFLEENFTELTLRNF